MPTSRWFSSLPLVLISALLGCPGDEPVDASMETATESSGACVPGQSIPCTCTGPDIGVQVCRSDGSGFDACACGMGDDTSSGSNGSTGGTGSTGELEGTDTGSTADTNAGGRCGDGIVDPGEICDDAGESAACDPDCTPVECGDAHVNATAGEACDADELGGATCRTLGLTDGTLACAPGCADYDTSGCAALPDAPVLGLGFSPIKQFDFAWAAIADANHYQLEESAAPGAPFVPLGGDIFGTSVSHAMPLHLRWQASYRLRACNLAGCSDSAVVDVTGSLAEAVGYVKASNTGAGDLFGLNVAISGDGSTLVVGAAAEDGSSTGIDGDQNDEAAPDSGAVYVFVRDGAGAWSQQAYVKASNTGQGDAFGAYVAISTDGDTLAVGAPLEDSSATGIDGDQTNDVDSSAGAVYVFVRDGVGTWSQQAYVKAHNTDPLDAFGRSVALSADGDTLAVGADEEDGIGTGNGTNPLDGTAADSGAVYVFVRDGLGAWSQQAYVKASNTDPGDHFGYSVALSADGDDLAVGAFEEDGSATGIGGNEASDAAPDAGAVYVFVRDGLGAWSQQAYVKASNTDAGDLFGGRGLALSADGNTLAVGAYQEDGSATGIDGDQASDTAPDAGAAYVFVRDGLGAWSQQAYVKASNTGQNDRFGARLDLSADGNVLAVGAYYENGDSTGIDGDQASDTAFDSGAAYVFVRDGLGAWSQQAYVKAPNTGQNDLFGTGVALSADAQTLVVTAYQEDGAATGIGGDQTSDLAANAGAVYLY